MMAVLSSQAQVKFGLKGGVNLAKMTLKSSGISIDPKTLIGYHFGVVSEFNLSDNFYLQPGILYSAKGAKYSISGGGMSADMSIKPSYIEVPVNALYKLDVSSAKLLIFAGPYFAYGVGGTYESDNETKDIKFGTSDQDDMKPLDIGLNFGVGADIKGFEITAQYGLGLSNLATDSSSGTEMKTKTIGISVAYLFGGK